MVYADVSLIYPLDYVVARDGSRLNVTEARLNKLVQLGINDVRRALKLVRAKADDYLDFRVMVVDTLCREYGFQYSRSAIHNILREDLDRLITSPMPKATR